MAKACGMIEEYGIIKAHGMTEKYELIEAYGISESEWIARTMKLFRSCCSSHRKV